MAASLSSNLPWDLASNRWAQQINPLLGNPICNGQILSNVAIATGTNTINHKLGRKLQGYLVIQNSAAVTFYDKQQTNQMPDLTLQLVASGAATISLYVF